MKDTAANGDKVSVNYVGTLGNGQVFDSTKGKPPLVFTLGEGMLLEKFEKCVLGMKLKEKRSVVIEPQDAYGEKREELIVEVPKENFPKDLKLAAGVKIQLRQKQSHAVTQAEIIRVAENSVTLDANHPLAGEKLHFEIELVSID
jgi:peptidylprolyl isomerase